LVLLVGGWWSYKMVKKRGGLNRRTSSSKEMVVNLLLQQLSSHDANVENVKMFNLKELEKAIDRLNVNRILG
jgi:hypothetical protein